MAVRRSLGGVRPGGRKEKGYPALKELLPVALERGDPPPPVVGYDLARFLAWLKKRDGYCDYEEGECYCRCAKTGIDLFGLVKEYGPGRIAIYRTNRTPSKKLVKLHDWNWACLGDNYGVEILTTGIGRACKYIYSNNKYICIVRKVEE